MIHDLRYAVRNLFKSPGVTSVAVASLALGIGGATAVFSVVNAVMLRPLPYRDPGQLVSVYEVDPKTPGMLSGVAPGSYVDARRQGRSFSQMAALREDQKVRIIGTEETSQVASALVTGDFFTLMGVPAQLGRTLGPEDAKPGAAPVAVISHGLWQRAFGGDPNAISRTVETKRASVPIVGVMPPRFSMPEGRDVWMPLDLDAVGSSDFSSGYLTLLGRLGQGVTLAQGNAEMRTLSAQRNRTALSSDMRRTELRGHLLADTEGRHRELLLLLLGAVSLLLVIAVVNVANLQLVQVTSRMREISIRQGLGATRGRLLRHFLTESLLLSLLGGVSGVGVALLCQRLMLAGATKVIPRAAETSLGGNVLTFTFLLSLVAGLTFGLLAVWRTGRMNLAESLQRGTTGVSGAISGHQWLRHGLAGVQIALSLTLFLGAGLLMRSFFVLGHTDLGLEPRRALVVSLGQGPLEILDRLRALPGVAAVAAVDLRPFAGRSRITSPIQVEGIASPESSNSLDLAASNPVVTPDYFQAMGMRMAAGRGLEARDGQTSSAIVVNEAFVKRFAQGADPIGKMVKTPARIVGPIVGVVKDARDYRPQMPASPAIYFPAGPTGWPGETHIVIRSHSDNLGFLAGLARAIVRGYDPRIPILSIRSVQELAGEPVAKERLTLLLYGTFALLALALCLVGIYGVLSYSVAQRTKEFGVRMALGALRHQVALLPLRQALPFLAGGVLAGLLGAFALGRLLVNQLYQVKPTDPSTLLVATALFLAAAAVACWIPARRAAKVNPMVALRSE